ncbi:hypothetical protein K438DRAFT_2096651 [Mycena galopus ATCC 62051]|nr:hypothetical protein K438DRAFT_2096651 [Mycena galopus ATCC 62051]
MGRPYASQPKNSSGYGWKRRVRYVGLSWMAVKEDVVGMLVQRQGLNQCCHHQYREAVEEEVNGLLGQRQGLCQCCHQVGKGVRMLIQPYNILTDIPTTITALPLPIMLPLHYCIFLSLGDVRSPSCDHLSPSASMSHCFWMPSIDLTTGPLVTTLHIWLIQLITEASVVSTFPFLCCHFPYGHLPSASLPWPFLHSGLLHHWQSPSILILCITGMIPSYDPLHHRHDLSILILCITGMICPS